MIHAGFELCVCVCVCVWVWDARDARAFLSSEVRVHGNVTSFVYFDCFVSFRFNGEVYLTLTALGCGLIFPPRGESFFWAF